MIIYFNEEARLLDKWYRSILPHLKYEDGGTIIESMKKKSACGFIVTKIKGDKLFGIWV